MTHHRRLITAALSFLFLALSVLALSNQVYGAAKGAVAKILLERALTAHLDDGKRHPPWRWADMYPVALMELPGQSLRRIILSGATGQSMAFGVGWLDGTAFPNTLGNCVLAGHRDRAFAFLEDLRPGDALRVTTWTAAREWVVQSASVTHQGDPGVVQRSPGDRLTLITCYPFNGIMPSDLRYVILCSPVGEPPEAMAF